MGFWGFGVFCQVLQILRILGGDLVFLKFRLTVLEFALRLSVDNALEQSIQMLSVLCIHAMFLFAHPPIKKRNGLRLTLSTGAK